MMKSLRYIILLSALAIPGLAQVQVSSLANTATAFGGISNGNYRASSFTTDNQSYFLTSVTLSIDGATDTSSPLFFSIYSDDGGLPGIEVTNGSLTGDLNPTGGLSVYTPSGSLFLDANTTYWLTTGTETGNGRSLWDYASDDSETGAWTIGNASAVSLNQGASWSSVGLATVDYLYSVSASPVPEPSQYALLFGCFSLAAVVFKRRRRTKQQPLE